MSKKKKVKDLYANVCTSEKKKRNQHFWKTSFIKLTVPLSVKSTDRFETNL